MPRIGRAYSSAVAIMPECTCTVPFGNPVEPEEYNQKHASSRVVGAGASCGLPFASTSLNARCPFANEDDCVVVPETITCFRNGNLPSRGVKAGRTAPDHTRTRPE